MTYIKDRYVYPIRVSALTATGSDRFLLFDLASGDLAFVIELVSERPVAGRRQRAKLHFCHG